jgi:hypothetical protein
MRPELRPEATSPLSGRPGMLRLALTWVAKRDEAAGGLAEPFGVYQSALYQFPSDGARWTLRVEHVSRRPLK